MVQYYDANIDEVSIHVVGNKNNDDGIKYSKHSVLLPETVSQVLTNYFLKPFIQNQEYFNLFHEVDLKYNEVFNIVSEVFDNPTKLYSRSVALAKLLYENSVHPKIKGGEFYTVYFTDCIVEGEIIDAIGLFKSENKDTFLKVHSTDDDFKIESDIGINITKLDKGCIIFNYEKDSGYLVASIDNTNKGSEAQYWTNDFLQITQRNDDYHDTVNTLSLCKSYITKELPNHFNVSKADQVDLLNKSVNFFKEKETFNVSEFSNEVMSSPKIIENFNDFQSRYQKENDIKIDDEFSISKSAFKKKSRAYKSVIKLDKNFHIYIHGDRNLIEQGVDETGKKYYKIYYQDEI